MLDSIQPKNQTPHRRWRRPHRYQSQQPRRKKRNRFRVRLAITMLVLLAVGIFVGSRVVILAQRIFDEGGIAKSFGQLFIASDTPLAGEEDGEIRILLLGIGGEGHDGGTLADTIMLATLKLPQGDEPLKVGLVSIPRDLVVNIPGYDYRKINSSYAFGESSGQENGPTLAIQAVEDVVGKQIPYYAVVNFDGFEDAIDELGGVKINIENGFTDSRYPDRNNGFLPPITFDAGEQKFDGERALQYARSRYGNNNQGSDFARSRRQQQILQAVWDEVSGINILRNFGMVNRVLGVLSDNMRTNLQLYEMKRLYDLAGDLNTENILSFSIDVQSGLLCNEIVEETGAYVLVPCDGLARYGRIQSIVASQFTAATLQKETPIIEIQNASTITGLADQTRSFLSLPNADFALDNYRGAAVYQEPVIYDNTGGQKNGTLEYLVDKLGARVASSAFPFQTSREDADFVIIVTESVENKLVSE